MHTHTHILALTSTSTHACTHKHIHLIALTSTFTQYMHTHTHTHAQFFTYLLWLAPAEGVGERKTSNKPVCTYVCMCIYTSCVTRDYLSCPCICARVCVYACIWVSICMNIRKKSNIQKIQMPEIFVLNGVLCLCACMYVSCMYVCLNVYMYGMYVYMYGQSNVSYPRNSAVCTYKHKCTHAHTIPAYMHARMGQLRAHA